MYKPCTFVQTFIHMYKPIIVWNFEQYQNFENLYNDINNSNSTVIETCHVGL